MVGYVGGAAGANTLDGGIGDDGGFGDLRIFNRGGDLRIVYDGGLIILDDLAGLKRHVGDFDFI